MSENEFVITPKVDQIQEFIEIAQDFSNPLEIVREAISNAFDANANDITLTFETVEKDGETILKINIIDNGLGMDKDGLHSFFDLGNSLNRNNSAAIGEKGHGTKVYFNSNRIELKTYKSGKCFLAIMDAPKKSLFARKMPIVTVKELNEQGQGTNICIYGYNNNRRDKFTHEQLKDYILWFTKFGSVEKNFGITTNQNTKLHLKGLNNDNIETLDFGHFFPNENNDVNALFTEYNVDAPKHYCKRILKEGHLKDMPEIKYQAVFYIEGLRVKYNYNPMLRRSGYTAPDGGYTVQDRYGIWLCKDFIPIQRKNDWITSKGSEYTKFHAFINCQKLRLTANRGSVENTPTELLTSLRNTVREIYDAIVESNDWRDISWLEQEAGAYNTDVKEKNDFKKRLEAINKTKTAKYEDLVLVEPRQENGVFSLFLLLSQKNKELFPFTIIDYDTHSGIDVIVKANDHLPIKSSKLYYVEFKHYLTKDFNHSFANLCSIVCWDINTNDLKNSDEVIDVAGEKRTLIIKKIENDYTRYYLDSIRSERKIEVFVLKYYLQEKLGIEFKPRTNDDCY